MVTDTTGEDALIGVSLGREIRTARQERNLSMRALAADAQISQPFLSQIESGQALPSVVTLFRLAKVLGISPSNLLPAIPEPAQILVTRANDGGHVAVDESGTAATSRILSSGAATRAVVQEYRFPAEAAVGEWFESDGELTVYVVSGTIRVELFGHGEWELSAGDALAHPGAIRNRWSVCGDEPATVLLAYATDN
ncbi:hypothetical protein GCM10009808_22590 [Microbacterium sediminicola]|uniref:HTH cro/C1-type domain-containing protein n=1 Tax=Microbacterium sediminicola TaxID=415210 RepID=A0ABN2IFR8_9MICO